MLRRIVYGFRTVGVLFSTTFQESLPRGSRGIITVPCPHDVAFVRRFNPDLPERTVGDKIRRTVGQSILKAQFFGNVAEVRVQIFELKRRKHSASGFFRESLEHLFSATLLVSAHSSRICTYR